MISEVVMLKIQLYTGIKRIIKYVKKRKKNILDQVKAALVIRHSQTVE